VSSFEVRVASPADRLPIYRMLELYQHDLSDIWDQDLDSHGEYGYALDRYWDSEGFHPFVATADGKYAGFALANQAVRIGTEGYWMDQFFVLKKYRSQGIGQLLASSVFAALPGRWEVGQMPQNLAAQAFWRKVLGKYTDGRFKEHEVLAGWWQGIIQVFESPATS
jgi:predicted acetyltransferase